jgi:hypothetical protein
MSALQSELTKKLSAQESARIEAEMAAEVRRLQTLTLSNNPNIPTTYLQASDWLPYPIQQTQEIDAIAASERNQMILYLGAAALGLLALIYMDRG